MSALKADIHQRGLHVCLVPIADMRGERFLGANPHAVPTGGVERMNKSISSVCFEVPVLA
jgi:hypothetical protein